MDVGTIPSGLGEAVLGVSDGVEKMAAGFVRVAAFDEDGKLTSKLVRIKELMAEIIPVTNKIDNSASDTTNSYKEQSTQLGVVKAGADALFTITSIGNEKQKKEMKEVALFSAYVSTAAGIARAFMDYKWPASAGVALTVASAGAVQINAIEAREMGGSVNAGQPYIVGEAGKELYVPEQSGTIIPNSQLGGVTLNFYGNITDKRFVQKFIVPEINKAVQMGRA